MSTATRSRDTFSGRVTTLALYKCFLAVGEILHPLEGCDGGTRRRLHSELHRVVRREIVHRTGHKGLEEGRRWADEERSDEARRSSNGDTRGESVVTGVERPFVLSRDCLRLS